MQLHWDGGLCRMSQAATCFRTDQQPLPAALPQSMALQRSANASEKLARLMERLDAIPAGAIRASAIARCAAPIPAAWNFHGENGPLPAGARCVGEVRPSPHWPSAASDIRPRHWLRSLRQVGTVCCRNDGPRTRREHVCARRSLRRTQSIRQAQSGADTDHELGDCAGSDMNGTNFAEIIEPVARHLLGEPNMSLSSPTQLRFGSNGSVSVEIAGEKKGAWYDHEAQIGGGLLDLIRARKGLVDGEEVRWLEEQQFIRKSERAEQSRTVASYDYRDECGKLLFQIVRKLPKRFVQRRPDGKGGWIWKMKGIKRVPYRLPELVRAAPRTPDVYLRRGKRLRCSA